MLNSAPLEPNIAHREPNQPNQEPRWYTKRQIESTYSLIKSNFKPTIRLIIPTKSPTKQTLNPNKSIYGCPNSLDGLGTFKTLFVSCPNCAPSWGRRRISIRLSRSEIREIREVWSWLLQNLPQWLLWVPQLSGWVGDLQNTFCELPQLCPKLGQA